MNDSRLTEDERAAVDAAFAGADDGGTTGAEAGDSARPARLAGETDFDPVYETLFPQGVDDDAEAAIVAALGQRNAIALEASANNRPSAVSITIRRNGRGAASVQIGASVDGAAPEGEHGGLFVADIGNWSA
jgi:hypothetical protein